MRIERSLSPWLAACAVALALLPGCPGTLDDKSRFLVDAAALGDPDAGACGDVPTRIFVPSCGTNGCHSATAPQQGLDLVSAGVASRVVGVQAKVCTGTLADPQNPAGSLLYTKLQTRPSCGAQMPLAQAPLSDADANCVLEWIATQ